jgi:hypothetical protein
MTWPTEPTGSNKLAYWLRSLVQACRSSQIVSGPNYRVKPGPNGTVLELGVSGGNGGRVRLFYLKEVFDKCLRCREHDGGSGVLTTDVYIAKPYTLRIVEGQTEVKYGITHTYTYSAGPDAHNKQREDAWTDGGDQTENQLVTPPWVIDSEIHALEADTYVLDPNSVYCDLIVVGPSRQWAKISA